VSLAAEELRATKLSGQILHADQVHTQARYLLLHRMYIDASSQRIRNSVLPGGMTGFSECGVPAGTHSYGTGCAR